MAIVLFAAVVAAIAGWCILGAEARVPTVPPEARITYVLPVGHGLDVAPVVRRFTGTVAEVGEPNADGEVYSFRINEGEFAADEVQHWRLTFITGERFATAYQIRESSAEEITIFSLDGPLNGIAEGDLFFVENVFALRRYDGAVAELGAPDADGALRTFVGNTTFEDGELREWRVTFLNGRRFASVFEIADNVGGSVRISELDGTLDGIAVGDRFFIENAPIGRAAPAAPGS
jgi:hypothetical protein